MEFDVQIDDFTMRHMMKGINIVVLGVFVAFGIYMYYYHRLWLYYIEYLFFAFIIVSLCLPKVFSSMRLCIVTDTIYIRGKLPKQSMRIPFSHIKKIWKGHSKTNSKTDFWYFLKKKEKMHDCILIKLYNQHYPVEISTQNVSDLEVIFSFLKMYAPNVRDTKIPSM